MARGLVECWRCERGVILPQSGGERGCVNCGAPAERPEPREAIRDVRTNRSRWDRTTAQPFGGMRGAA